jgi:hypothetical protein
MAGRPCSVRTVDTTSASAFRYRRDAVSSSSFISTFATTPRRSRSTATAVTSAAVPPHPYEASIDFHRRRSTVARRARGSSPPDDAVTATGSPRSRPAANPRPAAARQLPSTAAPPTMFSLAVCKIRLRRGGLPGLRGASDGSRRSLSANLGEKMPARLDARNVRYCRRVGFLAQIVNRATARNTRRELVERIIGRLMGQTAPVGSTSGTRRCVGRPGFSRL